MNAVASILTMVLCASPQEASTLSAVAGIGGAVRSRDAAPSLDVTVKDFGAKGDGVTNDTRAIQSAIDAVGVFTFESGNIRNPLTYGGGRIVFPPGRYVCGPVFVPGAIELLGAGLSTHIRFSGSAGEHWLQRDAAKVTKRATTENVVVRDMLITTTDPAPGDALHFVAVEKVRLSNLTISGFQNGIYISNSGVPVGESYYHTLDGVDAHDNVVDLYADKGGSVITCNGCYLWHSNGYDRADYTVILKSTGVVFNGGSIEGRPRIAQVYDQADSVTYNLGYSETRNLGAVGFKPLIKKKLITSGYATGGSLVNLPPGFSVVFEDFDMEKSDAVAMTTQARLPYLALASEGRFIPAIANGNMRYGDVGWVRNPNHSHGRVEYDSAVVFNSNGSMKLVHDGSGAPLEMNIPIDPGVTAQYVRRRVWLSALVRHSATATTEQLYLFGAGNTQAKFSSVYPVIDYGNGWRLYVADIPLLTTEVLNGRIRFTSSLPSDTIWVTNVQLFTDGFDVVPISRDVEPAPGAVSRDRGDTSQVLRSRVDSPIQRWATTLTADRAVTCSTENARIGDTFRVIRTGRGAFALSVCGVKNIPSGTAAFVDVTFDGRAWVLAAYGAL